MAKFQTIKDSNGQYHFNLRLRSGEVVLSSVKKINQLSECEQQIELVKENSKFAHRFSRETDDYGSYFILRDANNVTIGKSDYYKYWLDMETSIAAIRSHAANAEIVDSRAKCDDQQYA